MEQTSSEEPQHTLTPPNQGEMMSFSALIRTSLISLKQRFWQLIFIPVLSNILVVALLIGFGIAGGIIFKLLLESGSVVITIILLVLASSIGILFLLYVGIWSQAALIHAVVSNEKISLWKAFKRGSHDVFRLAAVYAHWFLAQLGIALLWIAALGGSGIQFWLGHSAYSLLFALLAVGLFCIATYINIKISFAPITVIKEHVNGKTAVLKSWGYTDGKFWKIFGRLFGFGLLIALAYLVVIIVCTLLKLTALLSIVQFVLGLIIPPLVIIFTHHLYQDIVTQGSHEKTPRLFQAGLVITLLVILAMLGSTIWAYYNASSIVTPIQGYMARKALESIQTKKSNPLPPGLYN